MAQHASAVRRAQARIAELRSQLHLTHRNVALVHRDAGQIEQALLAAQEALRYASDAQRPAVESLIADLEAEGTCLPPC
jgi:hypothetical protein